MGEEEAAKEKRRSPASPWFFPLVLVLVLLPPELPLEKSWFPLPLASVTLVILPQCKNIVKLSSLFRHFLSYLGLRGLQLLDPSAHWARIRSPCRPPLRLQTEIKEKNCYPPCFSPQNTVFRPIFFMNLWFTD